MAKTRFVTGLESCRSLWEAVAEPKHVFDLWSFRTCFQRHFHSRPSFLLLEDKGCVTGMLPLCYSQEQDMFLFFPGEVWKSKTWIERTPVYAKDNHDLLALLDACPERTYLRYMDLRNGPVQEILSVDELGYVLYPGRLHQDIAAYYRRFSGKKFKNLTRAIQSLVGESTVFHVNRLEDFDLLVDMSLSRYGEDSYLWDQRFRESFRDVMLFLYGRGMLRMVSLEIEGKTVAVDLGALCNNIYTVFLGGTDPDTPGVAKVMNRNHIEFAFQHGVSKVDFLCGDFHWKQLWHLDEEPLYKFVSPSLTREEALTGIFPADVSPVKVQALYSP
jgi:hypothetical protein